MIINAKHILYIEDEASSREVITMFLESQGFKITSSANGENALKKLAYFIEEKIFIDLIITDLIMPWIGGFELLKQMDRKNIKIPVLVTTAYGDEETRKRLIKLGCCSILEKPFLPEKLMEEIKKVINS